MKEKGDSMKTPERKFRSILQVGNGREQHICRNWTGSYTLTAMDYSWSRLVVPLLGDPHILDMG